MQIVIPTYSKNEKYCNLVVDFLNSVWVNHPEVWFLTDGTAINSSNVIRIESDNWIEILYYGLIELKNRYNSLEYIYLILEDLIPLWELSHIELLNIERIARHHKLKCVSFTTYDGDWGSHNLVEIEGINLYKVPTSFSFYSQLQPAIWELDHLINTCKFALDNKKLDPWSFEYIVLNEQHYVAEYPWTSIMNGFLVSGRVNLEAIWKIQLPEGKALRKQLLKDYLLDLPDLIKYRVKRKMQTIMKSLTITSNGN
jgi:hypothetical protein